MVGSAVQATAGPRLNLAAGLVIAFTRSRSTAAAVEYTSTSSRACWASHVEQREGREHEEQPRRPARRGAWRGSSARAGRGGRGPVGPLRLRLVCSRLPSWCVPRSRALSLFPVAVWIPVIADTDCVDSPQSLVRIIDRQPESAAPLDHRLGLGEIPSLAAVHVVDRQLDSYPGRQTTALARRGLLRVPAVDPRVRRRVVVTQVERDSVRTSTSTTPPGAGRCRSADSRRIGRSPGSSPRRASTRLGPPRRRRLVHVGMSRRCCVNVSCPVDRRALVRGPRRRQRGDVDGVGVRVPRERPRMSRLIDAIGRGHVVRSWRPTSRVRMRPVCRTAVRIISPTNARITEATFTSRRVSPAW